MKLREFFDPSPVPVAEVENPEPDNLHDQTDEELESDDGEVSGFVEPPDESTVSASMDSPGGDGPDDDGLGGAPDDGLDEPDGSDDSDASEDPGELELGSDDDSYGDPSGGMEGDDEMDSGDDGVSDVGGEEDGDDSLVMDPGDEEDDGAPSSFQISMGTAPKIMPPMGPRPLPARATTSVSDLAQPPPMGGGRSVGNDLVDKSSAWDVLQKVVDALKPDVEPPAPRGPGIGFPGGM